jgi:hypothetical protein
MGAAVLTGPRLDEWTTTSVHEAGHVVVGLHLGVPVTEAWIKYRSGWFGGWQVLGRTGTGQALVNDNDSVPFTIGGLEAEAIHLVHRDGVSLAQARRQVAGKRVHQRGDLADLDLYLIEADMTFEQAETWTNDLLCSAWGSVENVAAGLRERHRLSGRELARLT